MSKNDDVGILIGDPVHDDVVHARAARAREALVAQWRRVRTVRDHEFVHGGVDLERRAPDL